MSNVTVAIGNAVHICVQFDLATLDRIERHYAVGVYKLAEDFSAKAFRFPAACGEDEAARKAWLETDEGAKAWEAWMRSRKISEEVDWIKACTGRDDIAQKLQAKKVFEVARNLRVAFFKALGDLTSDDGADDPKSPTSAG